MKFKKFKINKKNSKKIAKQAKKNNVTVFLFISAPWCGHCKQMKPEYNKLLKTLDSSSKSNMMIGNIEDDMLNDFDLDTTVKGFPIFRMYGGGKKIAKSFHVKYTQLVNRLFKNITRVALHAEKLEITHPVIGKKIRFQAPIPNDMKNALNLLRNAQ